MQIAEPADMFTDCGANGQEPHNAEVTTNVQAQTVVGVWPAVNAL